MQKIRYLTKLNLFYITIEALYLNRLEEYSKISLTELQIQNFHKTIKNTENFREYYFIYLIKILHIIYKIINNYDIYNLINKIIKYKKNNQLKNQYLNKFKYIYHKNYFYYKNEAYHKSFNLHTIAIINLYMINKTIEKKTLVYLFKYLIF